MRWAPQWWDVAMLVGLLRTARPCCQWWRRRMPLGCCFVFLLCCLFACVFALRVPWRCGGRVVFVSLVPILCLVVLVDYLGFSLSAVLPSPSSLPFPFPSLWLFCVLLAFFVFNFGFSVCLFLSPLPGATMFLACTTPAPMPVANVRFRFSEERQAALGIAR